MISRKLPIKLFYNNYYTRSNNAFYDLKFIMLALLFVIITYFLKGGKIKMYQISKF